jgi:hypothetical protein
MESTPTPPEPLPSTWHDAVRGRAVPAQRHSGPPLPWPEDWLEAFSLRMAGHGMSISRALMVSDKRYALEQLVHAQAMGDEVLRDLSLRLFHAFESRQSGIAGWH